jgi:hypothetical protein
MGEPFEKGGIEARSAASAAGTSSRCPLFLASTS